MTRPLTHREPHPPTRGPKLEPTAPPPPPPKKVEVALGDRSIAVNVLPEQEARLASLLADGDLANDLAHIAREDGDPATLSADDFVRAGFDPKQAALLAELSGRVTPYTLDLARLDARTAQAFLTIVGAKDYLASAASRRTPAEISRALSEHFGALPAPARNAALAGLAHETAMLLVRDDERVALRREGVSYLEGHLRDPDRPLSEKHTSLAAEGVTSIDERSARIEAIRHEQLEMIRARARDVYRAVGGTGDLGETITLATGAGITTEGLAGQRDRAIGFLDYGRPTAQATTRDHALAGIASQEKRFTPTDFTRPVTFQLGIFGADPGFPGNMVTLERKDADGVVRSWTLEAHWSKGKTVLAPVGSTFEPGAAFDARGQTITFAPGSEPIRVRLQSSTSGGQLDEIGLTLSAVNASSEAPSLTVELRELFEPGRFDVANVRPGILARVHQQLDAAAAYVALHPELELGVALTANGPIDWSGARPPAELESYGPEGDRWSKDNTVDLRTSRLTVRFEAGKTGDVKIEASTDPVRAVLSGPRATSLSPEGRRLVAAIEARDPSLTDNDVLSALRAFAVLDLFQAKLDAHGVGKNVTKGREVILGRTRVTFEEYRAIAANVVRH